MWGKATACERDKMKSSHVTLFLVLFSCDAESENICKRSLNCSPSVAYHNFLSSTVWLSIPCRHPRTTIDRLGNGSNKSFVQHSHLVEVRVATYMCRMNDPQAPMLHRLTLRFLRLRPEKTLHPTGDVL